MDAAQQSKPNAMPEAVNAAAREVLTLRTSNGAPDLWLLEHSERVTKQAQALASIPELRAEPPDLTAVAIAALFHDAGWAVQARQGQVSTAQVCGRPTSDLQRELAVRAMNERLSGVLSGDVLQLAAAAIRECNNRYTTLAEAQVVAEAENLDEIGLLWVLRQFRQHQAEGRPLDQLLSTWRRQIEYHYWESRINDYLRWDISRRLARARLASVETFMAALARDRSGSDIAQALGGTP
ncbi:MAG: HD domain-containing protein [Planctomycetes bacterium]|nr:HD domain-containing protein [Planctomycetota bacterium]